MPDARCTRGPVCKTVEENAHEHTGSAEAIRHSLRNGFTAYSALSPATNSSCHRRWRISGIPAPGWAGMPPPTCHQQRVPGPHGFTVRNNIVRLRAVRSLTGLAQSKTRPAIHLRARRCRVHRILPRVNDDGQRPSVGRDGEGYRFDLGREKTEIFLQRGLDRKAGDLPAGQITLERKPHPATV